jgi:hypothetical protein
MGGSVDAVESRGAGDRFAHPFLLRLLASEDDTQSSADHVIVGDGVEVTLPGSWVGAAHYSDVSPPPDSAWTSTALAGYDDDHTRLYAFDDERIATVFAIDTGDERSLSEAADIWAGTFAENGYTPVSRDPATVDGRRAIRFVSSNPGTDTGLATTSDEYVFVVGSTMWVFACSSMPDDFVAAAPVCDSAAGTVRLHAG